MDTTKYIVIYDTYCGWCYGAAPIFDALVDTGVEVEALHRHLFQGPQAYHMSAGKGDLVLKADARISALTGQPFSQRYIDKVVLSDTEILASRYTAQAAALVHSKGTQKEFAVRGRLERARFVHGVSASDKGAVVAALIAEGVAVDEAELIGTPELAARAEATAQRAHQLMETVGASGVPTLLRLTGGEYRVIDHAAYYGRPDRIADLVLESTEQMPTSSSR